MEPIEKAITKTVFEDQECHHNALSYYEREQTLLYNIRYGDPDKIQDYLPIVPTEEVGTMSQSALQQSRYNFVALITLITRMAVEAGVEEQIAYNLSDCYIQKMDRLKSTQLIAGLYIPMITDFMHKIQNAGRTSSLSRETAMCLDYIYSHNHSRLTVKALAELTGLSPNYLSAKFRRETGHTIKETILCKKIEEAKNLLRFSDFSISDISQYLGFCSQSHFVSAFKKSCKISPKKYRDLNYKTGAWQTAAPQNPPSGMSSSKISVS